MTAAPTFTVLLPIVRPPALLPFAVRSVLAQERPDLELFIVCDGAPPETVACAEAFATEDPRVRVFAHPKGPGNGEAYRHQALQHARGVYVCQIGDDDLWLPHHLTEMAKLLEAVDFGHTAHFEIVGEGDEKLMAGDLADPVIRQRVIDKEANFFGAIVGGYRLAAYRALPEGWAPGPAGRPSDLNMWLKFLKAPGLRYGTRMAVTTLKLSAHTRRDWPIERRAAELATWAERLADPAARDRLMQAGLLSLSRGTYHLQYHNEDLVHHARGLAAQSAGALASQAAARQAEAAALAERDALAARLNTEIARATILEARLTAREHQVLLWRTRAQDMRRSWSWRLTKPFRRLARLIAGKPRR